ncbi:GNAT family N-acetyltransferase [Microbacterium gilvum]|uniref:N-acetyltransferase domain-containing protein n=1 Tax=Microbacterium gilvum TaxID=1336204 RepID=A0ABP8ZVG2_9MICO
MTGVPQGYEIGEADWDDEEFRELVRWVGAQTLALYDGVDLSKQKVRPLTRDDVRTIVAIRIDGRLVAAGLLSDAHGVWEVNRLAVDPDHRRLGLARAVLAELERRARRDGVGRLRLQTGFRQEAAIALYVDGGWTRIPPYGPYADDDIVSVCFEKELT